MSTLTEVPLIDFAKCGLEVENDLDDKQVLDVGKQLYGALQDCGFAYLKHTGISLEDIAKAYSVADEFFGAPLESKEKYGATASNGYTGYYGIGTENVDPSKPHDYKEVFRVQCSSLNDPKLQQWPDDVSKNFQSFTREFTEKCKKLALRILKTLAIGMKLKDTDHFINCHSLLHKDGNSTALRFTNYPPVPEAVNTNRIRLGRHSDAGCITLLFQDNIKGLQIETRQGEFIDVAPIEGTVVLNIGDMPESWSQNRLKSTKHRVINTNDPEKQKLTRRSIAYFVQPDSEVFVDEEFVFEENNAANHVDSAEKLPKMTAKDYLYMRLSHVRKY